MRTLMAGCIAGTLSLTFTPAFAQNIDSLIGAAKKEGAVNSLGMPGDWANWQGTWAQLNQKYGLNHQDTDLSSAEEIAKFEAEKDNASGDIGDVGYAFAPVAVQKGVTQPYKPTTWNQIPAWAKDKDGQWAVSYTGTIAFIVNKKLVKNPPKTWADLLKGKYKVALGDVSTSARASSAVLAAAYARGGSEKNLKPALDLFAQLAKQGRLTLNDPNIANLEKGEVEVGIQWDFNALAFRDKIDRSRFDVVIPQDGSLIYGYSTIINKYAKHPNAAKLAREYILSDAGQINLARGYARPIRSEVKIPQDVAVKLLPAAQYRVAKPIGDFSAWEATLKQLPRQWQEQVMVNMQ
ncbi:extracellular solute-binding protein [Crenobacter sp. SG2303]|uniref:Extracellular solute-binding protein n=1 Tax=Crenobacter oryzisoli TaxID=3056844 RepID=A0ABT7XKK3_9NEIS|nr:extracellular solute-binding protein [Crenobacter sp. SG2303]MDN0074326.1 extracellular solute-binding protein [Crenobacter sp. SG2303]